MHNKGVARAQQIPGLSPNRSRFGLWVLVATALGVAVALAACSSNDSASTTTTSAPTTTSVPSSSTPPQAEEPPEPKWVVQIGSPAADSFQGVAARRDEVVATGYTEGALEGTNAGGRDILAAVVGTDAKVRHLDQVGSEQDDSAFGVSSSKDTTITCGYTEGSPGAQNQGSGDAWCAPIDKSGVIGGIRQQGSTEWDRLYGVGVAPDGTYGYAGGYTLGLFPGASDTSAGVLGNGDALLWQVAPDGSPRWVRQFGTAATDWGQGVGTTLDGDALIVGYTQGDMDRTSKGGTDGFLARYDPSGLPRWTRQFGSSGADWPKGVAAGGDPRRGNETFVTVGSTDGAMAPALGGEQSTVQDAPRADGAEPAPSNAGGTDAFVTAFGSAGEPLWTTQLGSEGTEDAIGVAIDGNNVLVAGNTTGALDTTGAPSAGGKDGFLAALDLDTGSLRWIAQFGSPGNEDIYGVTITDDGLAVVAGQTTGQMGDTPNAGGTDGFLIAFPLPASGGAVASAL